MKKRVFSITLILALAIALAITALAKDVAYVELPNYGWGQMCFALQNQVPVQTGDRVHIEAEAFITGSANDGFGDWGYWGIAFLDDGFRGPDSLIVTGEAQGVKIDPNGYPKGEVIKLTIDYTLQGDMAYMNFANNKTGGGDLSVRFYDNMVGYIMRGDQRIDLDMRFSEWPELLTWAVDPVHGSEARADDPAPGGSGGAATTNPKTGDSSIIVAFIALGAALIGTAAVTSNKRKAVN